MIALPCKEFHLVIWAVHERILPWFFCCCCVKSNCRGIYLNQLDFQVPIAHWTDFQVLIAHRWTAVTWTTHWEHTFLDITLRPLLRLYLLYLNNHHFSPVVRGVGSRNWGRRDSSKHIGWCPGNKISLIDWHFQLLTLKTKCRHIF